MKSSLVFVAIMTFAIILIDVNYVNASPTLSIDSKGEDVITLQEKLKILGYDISIIDGEFGNETKAAVEEFQHDNKLTVTGIVNNATWRALKKAKTPKLIKIKDTKKDSSKENIKSNEKFKNNKLIPYGIFFLSKSKAIQVVETGKKLIGVPYVFGGTTPKGFDCSGFLQYIFKENGMNIPRLADEQYKLGKLATIKELETGDLVFFTTYEEGVSHCGIYVGNKKFLHTSSSCGVRIDDLNNVYWAPRFYGAKKIVEV